MDPGPALAGTSSWSAIEAAAGAVWGLVPGPDMPLIVMTVSSVITYDRVTCSAQATTSHQPRLLSLVSSWERGTQGSVTVSVSASNQWRFYRGNLGISKQKNFINTRSNWQNQAASEGGCVDRCNRSAGESMYEKRRWEQHNPVYEKRRWEQHNALCDHWRHDATLWHVMMGLMSPRTQSFLMQSSPAQPSPAQPSPARPDSVQLFERQNFLQEAVFCVWSQNRTRWIKTSLKNVLNYARGPGSRAQVPSVGCQLIGHL